MLKINERMKRENIFYSLIRNIIMTYNELILVLIWFIDLNSLKKYSFDFHLVLSIQLYLGASPQ